MTSFQFDDDRPAVEYNIDAIVSLTRSLLEELPKNGYVDAKRGVIESKCNPERLCQLATLVGVTALAYKTPRMGAVGKRLPDPIVFEEWPIDKAEREIAVAERAIVNAMSNT